MNLPSLKTKIDPSLGFTGTPESKFFRDTLLADYLQALDFYFSSTSAPYYYKREKYAPKSCLTYLLPQRFACTKFLVVFESTFLFEASAKLVTVSYFDISYILSLNPN